MTDLRDEYDRSLIDALCSSVRSTQLEYREWILSNYRYLKVKADIEEAAGNEQYTGQKICERLESLQNEMWTAFRSMDDKLVEVKGVVYDEDVLEAKAELQNELMALEKLVQDLQTIRRFIDGR